MTDLLVPDVAPLVSLQETIAQAKGYAEQAKAASTRRAYQSDWRDFSAWCELRGLATLPAAPATVALYLSDLADRRTVSTIQRRLATISQAHQTAHLETPTKAAEVRAVMQGIRRVKGAAQQQKQPAVTQIIRAMVEQLTDGPLGVRDRALLLLGFAGAFRRAELVALDVADVSFTADGLIVRLPRSKTDQEGQGATKGIPYGSSPATCPVRALRAWLDTGGVTGGPIFRPITRHGHVQPKRLSAYAVALVVKRAAAAARLDPAAFSGHSLRAGLATAAAAAGVSERAIMNQTGHRSLTVARRYIREGSLFRENAAASVGL
jgi:site-specific recombinase XerD